ncbi:hypothetical protein SNE40_011994 [Patella caerulea]|uniref:Ribosomal protein eL8/eL30/eS12/Gadd45 domain-containing protein n=1 Tax=Patella caerulea TaxID=87958 RepID=A0AAN8JRB8_PATCE
MTLPETGEASALLKPETKCLKKYIGNSLRESMWQAMEEQRITCGVIDCAKLLKCYYENVMLCVLPEAGSEEVSVHIQHTLIEAFCWENDIRILKVKNQLAVGEILTGRKGPCVPDNNNIEDQVTLTDISCVMIEYPMKRMSMEDEHVIEFHDDVMLSDVYPKPVIELPI